MVAFWVARISWISLNDLVLFNILKYDKIALVLVLVVVELLLRSISWCKETPISGSCTTYRFVKWSSWILWRNSCLIFINFFQLIKYFKELLLPFFFLKVTFRYIKCSFFVYEVSSSYKKELKLMILPALPEISQFIPFHDLLKLLWIFFNLSNADISYGFFYT